MDSKDLSGLRRLPAGGLALALLLALGAGCSNGIKADTGPGGTGPFCIWENLCECQCAGSPEVRITTDQCETVNGAACLPWGSGGGNAGGGGGTAGAGATGSGGNTTLTDCTFDHQVCLTQ